MSWVLTAASHQKFWMDEGFNLLSISGLHLGWYIENIGEASDTNDILSKGWSRIVWSPNASLFVETQSRETVGMALEHLPPEMLKVRQLIVSYNEENYEYAITTPDTALDAWNQVMVSASRNNI